MDRNDITPEKIFNLEINLLLLCYTFSDQYGNVYVLSAVDFAKQHNIGTLIPSKMPKKILQYHLDMLMDNGLIPDTRLLMNKIALLPVPPKRKRKKDDSTDR